MTIEDLKEQNCIIYETVSGSRAYGLELPHSDTDIKGVFVLPADIFFGTDYIPQVNDKTNDVVYYELGRFISLLCKSNPNLLEMLFVSPEHITYQHPIFAKVDPSSFLSRHCKVTFAQYGLTQIKKAKGLHKKILNPMEEQRKSIAHFCYVLEGKNAIKLPDWLKAKSYQMEYCGLSNIPHAKDLHALFYDATGRLGYKGIGNDSATEVLLSSIPKEEPLQGYLYFNKDGYTKYCKDHRDYWHWVAERNKARYEHTLSNDKNYDAKNLMHAFRLLDTAEGLFRTGELQVKRPNREELLAIRDGQFSYEELMDRATLQLSRIEELVPPESLPEQPDIDRANQLLISIRKEWYKSH